MKYTKYMVTAGILIVLIAGGQLLRSGYDNGAFPGFNGQDPKSHGRPGAPLHIIEYSDFQCPACAAGYKVLKAYLRRNPGKAYIQYRYYPLATMHPHAVKLAVYAECAAQQKRFLPVHDAFFEQQNALRASASIDGAAQAIAREAGLDLDALRACVADSRTADAVFADKSEGLGKGVRATPSYFVNGQMIVGSNGLKRALGDEAL